MAVSEGFPQRRDCAACCDHLVPFSKSDPKRGADLWGGSLVEVGWDNSLQIGFFHGPFVRMVSNIFWISSLKYHMTYLINCSGVGSSSPLSIHYLYSVFNKITLKDTWVLDVSNNRALATIEVIILFVFWNKICGFYTTWKYDFIITVHLLTFAIHRFLLFERLWGYQEATHSEHIFNELEEEKWRREISAFLHSHSDAPPKIVSKINQNL